MSTLLFVHIGTKYPKYLLNNIVRTRELFKNHKIALVGEEAPDATWLQVNDVYFKKHEKNVLFDSEFKFAEFEKDFRSGYWRHTLERLLSLENYHKDFPNEKVIHIESDVIIFPNFPFDKINTLSKVTWLNHSSEADIAALVFSPSWQSSKEFSSLMIKEYAVGGGSDMDILLRLREKNSQFGILPTFNKELLEFSNTTNTNLIKNTAIDSQNFFGVFDALGVGVWISGFDPRNKFGFTVIHTRELIDSGILFIDPSKLNYEVSEEGNLFITIKENRIPIYNLHVHSKDKELLSANWEKKLRYLVAIDNSKSKVVGFSPLIITQLVLSSLKNGSLRDFILQIPAIRRTRSRFSNR